MVVVTVETDCHLAPEMVVVTVVTDCRQCLERPVSKVVDLGWMDKTPETSTMPQQQPQQQQANVSQNVQGFASTTNLDASGQGYPVQGCQQGNVPVMQGQGPAWFGAQWIPQQQTFMQQNSQACVPSFGCASMPGGPRSGSFPNLGVNPMSCQGNMPSGPVGASLGGLTPQAAQIEEVMAMLGKHE